MNELILMEIILELKTKSMAGEGGSYSNELNYLIRSIVKACNKEAEPNFYGKLYLWRYIKTIILQVVKMNR